MKCFLLLLLVTTAAHARVLLTQEQALATAFPAAVKVTRQKFFLTPEQLAAARSESGVDFDDRLVVRYAGSDGRVDRVEILAFNEPTDYFPKRRWLDQLLGRHLDRDLALNRGVRPISGASLTGRALVNATRKVLALHHVLTRVTPR